VPIHNGFLVLIGTTGDTLIGFTTDLLRDRLESFGFLFLALEGNVDVGNFPVHHRHQVDASNLGDNGENLGVSPCVIDKRSTPGATPM
jgi:hypothetical protein